MSDGRASVVAQGLGNSLAFVSGTQADDVLCGLVWSLPPEVQVVLDRLDADRDGRTWRRAAG